MVRVTSASDATMVTGVVAVSALALLLAVTTAV
jgi:hypothetical protein